MRYSLGFVALASVVSAATHDIVLGNADDDDIFSPKMVNAAMGDMLRFHFWNPGSHSVAQSQFSSPCMYMQGGLWSGFVTQPPQGESNMVYEVMVNSTDPMWLYCATSDHCQEGMVMGVNPPSDGSQTVEMYSDAAENAGSNNPPSDTQTVVGGMLVDMSSSSGGSSGGSSSSSMMPSMSGMPSMTAGSMPSMSSSAAASMDTGSAVNMKAPAAGVGLAVAMGALALI